MSHALPPPGQGRLGTPLSTPLSRVQVTGGIGQGQTSYGSARLPLGSTQSQASGSLRMPAGSLAASSQIRTSANTQPAARSSPLVAPSSRTLGLSYQTESVSVPSNMPMGSSLVSTSNLTGRRSASPLTSNPRGEALLGAASSKPSGTSMSSAVTRLQQSPGPSRQVTAEVPSRRASDDAEVSSAMPSRLSTSLAEPSLAGLQMSTPASTTTSLSVGGYPASSDRTTGRSAVAPSVSGAGTSLGISSLGPGRVTELDMALEELRGTQEAPPRPFRAPPPFYWVPTPASIGEFEVSGACGEVVTKIGNYQDENSALPIAGTMRMAKGGLYIWTLQVVRQSPHRPNIQFGVQGAGHARPWRLVSSGRCSRSRDEGPWVARPGGDKVVSEGDFVHCEADFRGLDGPIGSFAFAINNGPFETAFEDIPLSDGPLFPVVSMGGDGSTCRLCGDS